MNTFAALVIPTAANGCSIFLLKGFFDSLPKEPYESATLDDASELRIFTTITMSLSAPILAMIALNTFTNDYGAFMLPYWYVRIHADVDGLYLSVTTIVWNAHYFYIFSGYGNTDLTCIYILPKHYHEWNCCPRRKISGATWAGARGPLRRRVDQRLCCKNLDRLQILTIKGRVFGSDLCVISLSFGNCFIGHYARCFTVTFKIIINQPLTAKIYMSYFISPIEV